jgi:hypothetical protein
MMLSDDSLVKFIWLKLGEFDKKGWRSHKFVNLLKSEIVFENKKKRTKPYSHTIKYA